MTLDDFLNDFPGGARAFAPLIAMTETSLSRIRRGEQNISRATIRQIVEATGGAVTANDLVFGNRHGADATLPALLPPTGQSEELSGGVAP